MRDATEIRPIGAADENTIIRLADSAPHVHLHPDYSTFDDWLTSPAALMQTRNGKIRGLLVAHCDPPPIAWLRLVVIDQYTPDYPLRKLIAAASQRLQGGGTTHLACLSSSRWLDEALPKLGFTIGQEIMGMAWQPAADSVQSPDPQPRDDGLVIRGVMAADFPQLIQIEHTAFDDPLWWSSQTQMERAARGTVNFDVAELDGEIVGFTFGAWAGRREVHVVRIAVAPHMRRRGIGAALLQNALETYRAENFQHVSLNTQSDNAVAHRLYQRFGFRETGDRFSIWVLLVTS